MLAGVFSNVEDRMASGHIAIHNPADAGVRTRVNGFLSRRDSSANNPRIDQPGSQRTAKQADDAFQLRFSSGNIASMNYTLYGLRSS